MSMRLSGSRIPYPGLFLLLFSSGKAETAGLEEMIRMGLANNRALAAERQDALTAAADTLSAATAVNPHLEIEALHNLEDPARPAAGIRLSKEFQPGIRERTQKAARAEWQARSIRAEAERQDLVERIRTAWYDWQLLHRRESLQREVQERWEGLTRLAAAQVGQGRLSELDRAEAELSGLKARQEGLRLVAERQALEQELRTLTGGSAMPAVLEEARLDSLPDLPPLDSLVAWAEAGNPGLAMGASELAAARLQATLQEKSDRPPFNLSVGYEREVDGHNLVGAGVELPLAFFNRNQAGIQKARSGVKAAELRLAAEKEAVKAETAMRHGRIRTLSERYGLYRSRIRDLIRRQMALSEKGFREGLLGVFDLSRVQAEYLAQEGEALDVLAEFYREWNRLSKVVGGSL